MMQQRVQRFLPHVMLYGSYMSERMVIRAKELQVEKAAMEEAMAKDEVLRCSGMLHAAVFSLAAALHSGGACDGRSGCCEEGGGEGFVPMLRRR